MSDHVELDRETTRAKEPAKAWRNKWRALYDIVFENGDSPVSEGEVFWSRYTWPSKEIAEEMAAKSDAEELRDYGVISMEWLGAYPVPT